VCAWLLRRLLLLGSLRVTAEGMDACPRLAQPLAQATAACLRQQQVDVNVAILTSYLLDTYPDGETARQLTGNLVLSKQIDSQGKFGDVSIRVEECDGHGSGSNAQLLLLCQKNSEKVCFLVNGVNKDSYDCCESLQLGAHFTVGKLDAGVTLYTVQADWIPAGGSYNSDEEESIVLVEDNSDKEEDSFEVLEKERVDVLEKLVAKMDQDQHTSIHTKVTDDSVCSEQTPGNEDEKERSPLPEEPINIPCQDISQITSDESNEEIEERQRQVLLAVSDELKHRRCQPVETCTTVCSSLRGNGRKKMLVIGKTGTGKSSLCNVLSGNLPNSTMFPVSGRATTCTQETKLVDTNFCGDPKHPLSIIDTIGFDDPTKDHDAKIIAELVLQLQQNCDHVNTFMMAVNGQNPRLDGSLLQMIQVFEKMFTDKFWDQVVVVFTRLHMDTSSRQRREEENDGNTDDLIAKEYLSEVEKVFGVKSSRLNYLFLDSQYRKTDADEVEAFTRETDRLYHHLMKMPDLPTSEINIVLTENQKLWAKINKLKLAVGGAAVGGAAAIGVATVKSAVADAAMKEVARAVAEKAVAETTAAAAQAELARIGQELAGLAAGPVATAATGSGFGGLAAAAPVLGILAAVTAWYFGIPVPIPI